jgi:hypothetical protein
LFCSNPKKCVISLWRISFRLHSNLNIYVDFSFLFSHTFSFRIFDTVISFLTCQCFWCFFYETKRVLLKTLVVAIQNIHEQISRQDAFTVLFTFVYTIRKFTEILENLGQKVRKNFRFRIWILYKICGTHRIAILKSKINLSLCLIRKSFRESSDNWLKRK